MTSITIQHTAIETLITNIEQIIKGKRPQIELVLTCLFAKGHILLEDNPGTGKTVLSKTLAASISGAGNQNALFKRIQFTPDLLPMDLLGTHIFDDQTKEFIFKKGPLFTNVLLADEINRASPKVQSALLECMAEHQITMGETTYRLHDMFFTIATQNPIEMEGTYPLPAAQLDRFYMKINFGYVDEDTEWILFKQHQQANSQSTEVAQVLTLEQILSLQQQVQQVQIHDEILRAALHIVRATRTHESIQLGASTRAGLALLQCLKAYAMIQGRTYVVEDDLHTIAEPVLHHRLLFRNKEASQNALKNIVQSQMQKLNKLNLI